jgi:hypothetical protein
VAKGRKHDQLGTHHGCNDYLITCVDRGDQLREVIAIYRKAQWWRLSSSAGFLSVLHLEGHLAGRLTSNHTATGVVESLRHL